MLFIDEAYSIVGDYGNDFGHEVVSTLLKEMEDRREEFVVIVAGYSEPMNRFINSNPGLKSRFRTYIDFPDYNLEEMMSIFHKLCKDNDYTVTPEADKKIRQILTEKLKNKGKDFANGRDVRNLFEKIISVQAKRVVGIKNTNTITITDLKTITLEDVSGISK